MEAFLSSNGVQFEHYELSNNNAALERLNSLGIKTAPVTIVDGQPILGYNPQALELALDLKLVNIKGPDSEWLAQKFTVVLKATIEITSQFTDKQLDTNVTWREQKLRDLILHIFSFAQLASVSHKTGRMESPDLVRQTGTTSNITTSMGIKSYGVSVLHDVIRFLGSPKSSLTKTISTHYGGHVTALELMSIILRHGTHHLKQLYWHMETNLGIFPKEPATESDLDGIATPMELI